MTIGLVINKYFAILEHTWKEEAFKILRSKISISLSTLPGITKKMLTLLLLRGNGHQLRRWGIGLRKRKLNRKLFIGTRWQSITEMNPTNNKQGRLFLIAGKLQKLNPNLLLLKLNLCNLRKDFALLKRNRAKIISSNKRSLKSQCNRSSRNRIFCKISTIYKRVPENRPTKIKTTP